MIIGSSSFGFEVVPQKLRFEHSVVSNLSKLCVCRIDRYCENKTTNKLDTHAHDGNSI